MSATPAFSKYNRAEVIHETNALVERITSAKDVRIDSNKEAIKWLRYKPEGGATLYSYYLNGVLCRIVADILHSRGLGRIEMFYDPKGAPVFFYEREDYFPMKGDSIDRTQLEFGHEARYYVRNRALVESRRRGKDRFGPVTSPSSAVKKLLAMSDLWSHFKP